jgi:hypothetical protein
VSARGPAVHGWRLAASGFDMRSPKHGWRLAADWWHGGRPGQHLPCNAHHAGEGGGGSDLPCNPCEGISLAMHACASCTDCKGSLVHGQRLGDPSRMMLGTWNPCMQGTSDLPCVHGAHLPLPRISLACTTSMGRGLGHGSRLHCLPLLMIWLHCLPSQATLLALSGYTACLE